MSRKSEVISVGVSHRVLWIGSAAYPLHNIARAQTIKLVPNRAKALGHYVIQLVLWFALMAGAIYVIDNGLLSLGDRDELAQPLFFVFLVLIGISTINLVVKLLARTYYAMVIETAGNPQTTLVSTDKRVVSSLVRQTMEAIDNPEAEFRKEVTNITNIGEQFNAFGKHAVGKQATYE
jgi:ABC-type multidrug transport system fused ATPase/permease subunit